MLSSCGFKPLYKQTNDRPYAIAELAKIQIDIVDDEVMAKDFKFSLERTLNPRLSDVKKEYLLKIKLKKETYAAVIRTNSEVGRYNIKSIVDFELYRLGKSKVINSGSIVMISSFDTVSAEFADYTAEGYSATNNTRQSCEELKNRLATILEDKTNENKY